MFSRRLLSFQHSQKLAGEQGPRSKNVCGEFSEFCSGDIVKVRNFGRKSMTGDVVRLIEEKEKRNGERVWSASFKKLPKTKINVRESKLSIIGRPPIVVKYFATVTEGSTEQWRTEVKEFKFKHLISNDYFEKVMRNPKEMKAFMKKLFARHQSKMMEAMKWHCAACAKPATKIASWPISHLDEEKPFISDFARPVCKNLFCLHVLNKKYNGVLKRLGE